MRLFRRSWFNKNLMHLFRRYWFNKNLMRLFRRYWFIITWCVCLDDSGLIKTWCTCLDSTGLIKIWCVCLDNTDLIKTWCVYLDTCIMSQIILYLISMDYYIRLTHIIMWITDTHLQYLGRRFMQILTVSMRNAGNKWPMQMQILYNIFCCIKMKNGIQFAFFEGYNSINDNFTQLFIPSRRINWYKIIN